MPRKNPLPAAERAIGTRLADLRKRMLIPQSSFASALQVSRAQLINYETGISPLPWSVAQRACKILDVHPARLMGALKHGTYVDYGASAGAIDDADDATFSDVYHRIIAPEVRDEAAEVRTAIESALRELESAISRARLRQIQMTAAHLLKIRELLKMVEEPIRQSIKSQISEEAKVRASSATAKKRTDS